MKKTFQEIVSQLTNNELRHAFDEIVEFRRTGILAEGGVVRAVHADFEESNDTDYPVASVEVHILLEMSKRAYSLLPE